MAQSCVMIRQLTKSLGSDFEHAHLKYIKQRRSKTNILEIIDCTRYTVGLLMFNISFFQNGR